MEHAVNQVKVALRATLRQRLAAVAAGDAAAWSGAISARIIGAPWFRDARTVLAYLAIGGEADIEPVVREALTTGRRVCLPRIDWRARAMVPAAITSLDAGLVASRHGIREPGPGAPAVAVEELDLVFVPGLGFDDHGGRIGRGAGFYDRFLARPGLRALTVGPAFEVQLVDRVPLAAHDVRLRAVATERRLIQAN